MATANKYRYSRAYFKILELIRDNPKENVFVIRGGQGAGKTISILQLVVQSLLRSDKEATVLSSELSKMKKTVIRDYKKLAKDWGVIQSESDFNKSESKHEYPNDSYLDFIGADVSDVGKGFRRDILYINEADKIAIDTAVQFISRAKLTIIDYNPDKLFWGDDYINEKNFITLTFEDNEYLPESEVRAILEYKDRGFYIPTLPENEIFQESNIKNKYWANKWKVYGLGLVGSLDGVIFDNWREVASIPSEAKLLGFGLDFGYTNDPSAAIAVWECDGKKYLDQILYAKGLLNSDIVKKLKAYDLNNVSRGYADSAEPKSIAEINKHGFSIKPVEKGTDSINFGIAIMQEESEFYVTSRSTDLIKELRSYTWDTDKTGATLNRPVDDYNHAIDAVRYFFMMSKRRNHAPAKHGALGKQPRNLNRM